MSTEHPPLDGHVTFLYTDDLARAARFYGDILGLEMVLDQGTCHIWRVSSTGFVGVCQREEAARPDGVIVTLVTDEVDAWAEHLRAKGVTLEKEPSYNSDYDIYHLFVRDPDGYMVEIQTFRDPEWPL